MPSEWNLTLNGQQNQSALIQNCSENEQLGIACDNLELNQFEIENDYELVRFEHYQLMIPVLLCLCTLAIIINIAVLLISSRSKKPVSLTLKLTLGLAAADIYTSGILGAGLYLHSYLLYVQNYLIPHYFCIAFVVESLRLGAILASVLHLLLLAINHYLATKAPIFYRHQFTYLSRLQIFSYIIGIWITVDFRKNKHQVIFQFVKFQIHFKNHSRGPGNYNKF